MHARATVVTFTRTTTCATISLLLPVCRTVGRGTESLTALRMMRLCLPGLSAVGLAPPNSRLIPSPAAGLWGGGVAGCVHDAAAGTVFCTGAEPGTLEGEERKGRGRAGCSWSSTLYLSSGCLPLGLFHGGHSTMTNFASLMYPACL